MILLNTTFCISPAAEDTFLEWAKCHYIPSIKHKGHNEIRLLKIPSPQPEVLTYGVQFCVQESRSADNWQNALLSQIITETCKLPADSMLHFTTIMEIIDSE